MIVSLRTINQIENVIFWEGIPPDLLRSIEKISCEPQTRDRAEEHLLRTYLSGNVASPAEREKERRGRYVSLVSRSDLSPVSFSDHIHGYEDEMGIQE